MWSVALSYLDVKMGSWGHLGNNASARYYRRGTNIEMWTRWAGPVIGPRVGGGWVEEEEAEGEFGR